MPRMLRLEALETKRYLARMHDVGGMTRKDIPKEKLEPRVDRTLCLNVIVAGHGILFQSSVERDGRFYIKFLERSYQKLCGTRSEYEHRVSSGNRRSGARGTIQTLEDMLRACVIDFGKGWQRLGLLRTKLELPQELSRVHHTFHVSNLKKCYADEPLVMPLEGIHVDDKLQFVEEPVEIMEREIKRLKRSRIPLVKVRWNSRRGPEFTWEREDSFKQKYPQLFTNQASSSTTRS
ncbi:hypothetical protein Tco_0415508 [Tanacetum coccineum]